MKFSMLDEILMHASVKIARHKMDDALNDLALRTLSRVGSYHAHLYPNLGNRIKDGIYGFLEKHLPQEYLDRGFSRVYQS